MDTPDSLISLLLPSVIDLADALLLLATSFCTALITATLGVGGGVLLLAVIASVLPPLAIIPVHGLVQAAANTNRAIFTRQHLNRTVFSQFLLGALVGAALASVLVVQLPTDTILLCVAGFILFLTWGPKLQIRAIRPWPLRIASALTTLLSMFVGASGPLVAAFVHQLSEERFERVATFSACMSVQHGLKLLVFGGLGFAFSEWLALVAGMVLTGVAGTWVGLNLLQKISNQRFSQVFRIILTLMALKLLFDAGSNLLS
ncbi:sulfite exporter TauE/SafE family protein [Motiliproteus coralliicola]|uniref:Probable membrane transporter protein n=1 Tax=Motiliproteus coralliicola TaxID=2283196 RepID=A0A369WDM9_9GAMM|nr:sulfite exporter TauE/SafE family protein [Motiliproteus coralliicola]RDE18726.1 sulfite exporter TauE/SafE family protein [Motiliproteus coralliicola]